MKKSLRTFARGKPCMLRLSVCNFSEETTVLAHIRRANVAGIGQKPPDTCAVWACSACHDWIDGRIKRDMEAQFEGKSREDLERMCESLAVDSVILHALIRQLAWYDKHEILIPVIA